jgi:hypothetical protein
VDKVCLDCFSVPSRRRLNPAPLLSAAEGVDPCENIVFLPIRSTGENVLGFLILGVNSQKQHDDDYRLFIDLLSRQLTTSMAAAVLFSRKLVIQTHEAIELESRFRRMADLAPVGMFHIDPVGALICANDYCHLTSHPRDVSYLMSSYNVISEVDRPLMDLQWAKLMSGEPVSFERRLDRLFEAEEMAGGKKVQAYTWITTAAYPENAEDGTVVGILGCLTDISRQKWAEGF